MSRQEERLKSAVSNKTPVFKTILRERFEKGQYLNELLPRSLDVGRKIFAKSLSRKIGKNVRITADKLLIDAYKVQKNTECLMRIVEIYWNVFKNPALYNSEYFDQEDENNNEIEEDTKIKPASQMSIQAESEQIMDVVKKGNMYAKKEGKKFKLAKKEDIIRHMRKQFDSLIPLSDKKCQNIANTVLKNIRNHKKNFISAVELFIIMDLSGDEVMEALTEIKASVSGSFDDFLDSNDANLNSFVNNSPPVNLMDKIDAWKDTHDLEAEDVSDIINAHFATEATINAQNEVEYQNIINQQFGRINVTEEINDILENVGNSNYELFDPLYKKNLQEALDERENEINAIASTEYSNYAPDQARNLAIKNLESVDEIKERVRRKTWYDVSNMPEYKNLDILDALSEKIRNELNMIQKEKKLKLRGAKISASLKKKEEKLDGLDNIISDTMVKIKTLEQEILDIGTEDLTKKQKGILMEKKEELEKRKRNLRATVAQFDELRREYEYNKVNLEQKEEEIDQSYLSKFDWARRQLNEEENRLKEAKRIRQEIDADTRDIDETLAKLEQLGNDMDSMLVELTQGEGKINKLNNIITKVEQIKGSGVGDNINIGTQNIVSNETAVQNAPADPSLVGKTTTDFLKEFQDDEDIVKNIQRPMERQPLPAPPLPTKPPTFEGKTTKEAKEDRLGDIELIKSQLDLMAQHGEIMKATNQDMINVVMAMMQKYQINPKHLKEGDIAKIIEEFYKKYPDLTVEPKPTILKLPKNAEDKYNLSTMFDWMVTHMNLPLIENDQKITAKRAMELMVEALELTKPEGKKRTYPKSKWMYDRDLSKVSFTTTKSGIKTSISVSGRFGITSLNSKFETEYLDYLNRTINDILIHRGQMTEQRKKELWDKAADYGYSWAFVYVEDPLLVLGMSQNEMDNVTPEFRKKLDDAFRSAQEFYIKLFNKANLKAYNMTIPSDGLIALANRHGVITKVADPNKFNFTAAAIFDRRVEQMMRDEWNKNGEVKTLMISAFLNGAIFSKSNPSKYKIQQISEMNPYVAGRGKKQTIETKVTKKNKKGSGIKVYKNHLEMIERLGNLTDSIDVGNTSMDVKNEIMELLDALLKGRKITKKEHKIIYDEYIKE